MYRAAVIYFCGLFVLSIGAFWPTYFSPTKYETDWHVHLHAAVMFSWLALLIAQAALIRARRTAIHRQLGKASYVLAPAAIASTLLLARYRLGQRVDAELLYFFYVQLSLIGVFALSWGLAIANRRQPAVHMRYIVCSALTLVDPVVARLLFFGLDIPFPPTQVITYALVDAILLLLVANDRRMGSAPRVYAAMLPAFVVTQVPTFFLYKLPAWEAFARWYASLPLP